MRAQDGYVTTGDGVRLFYQKVGSGAQTVLVPNGIYLVDDLARLAANRTIVFFDVRNRGQSDHVADQAKLERGVLNDADDLDAVRRHFSAERVDVIGHSYVGFIVVLYAMKYPAHVNRVVQIGPIQPHAGTQYPAQLRCTDETFQAVMAKLGALEQERATTDATTFCRKFWSIIDPLYVTNPADVGKLSHWHRCDSGNERNLMPYLRQTIMPSIARANPAAEDLAQVKTPVLTIHGTSDRSAPYGGGREWAMELGNARLLSVKDGGHAPWIESPEVIGSMETFLSGSWPDGAERIEAL